MSDMQAFVDELNRKWQRERAQEQMTLGELIDNLASFPPNAKIDGLVEPHSYRGYYCDLAFEPTSEPRTAGEMLAMCRNCMGQDFTGYKGGEFTMSASTPVWIAYYGATGRKIMALDADGKFTTGEDT
jgi:hypothetical protein